MAMKIVRQDFRNNLSRRRFQSHISGDRDSFHSIERSGSSISKSRMNPGKKLIALRFRASDEKSSSCSVVWDDAYRKSCDFCILKKLKCSGRGSTCKKCISKGICCTYSLKHRSVVRAREMGMLTSDIVLDAEDALNYNIKPLSTPEPLPPLRSLPSIHDLLSDNSSSSPEIRTISYTASQPRDSYFQSAYCTNYTYKPRNNKLEYPQHFMRNSESSVATDDTGSSSCSSEYGRRSFSPSHIDDYKPPNSVDTCQQKQQLKKETDDLLSKMINDLNSAQRSGNVGEVVNQLQTLAAAGFIAEDFCNRQIEKVMLPSRKKL